MSCLLAVKCVEVGEPLSDLNHEFSYYNYTSVRTCKRGVRSVFMCLCLCVCVYRLLQLLKG